MANKVCPTCGHNFAEDGIPKVGLTPLHEDPTGERFGILQFCSEACRDAYRGADDD